MLKSGRREVAVGAERHAADDVAQRDAEHQRQRRGRETEHDVTRAAPQRVVELVPELEAEPAADQQPEHDDQPEVEAAERAGVRLRERHEQHAAAGEQPDLVAVPDRPDRRRRLLALLLVARQEEVQRADAEVEAVEDDVHRDHHCQEAEPGGLHQPSPAPAAVCVDVVGSSRSPPAPG